LTKDVEQYFSILYDYFGEAYGIASKNRFVKEKYWNKVLEVYDPSLIIGVMDSLYDDLRKIDWGAQEQHIRNTGGLKVSYSGAVYGYLQDVPQTAQFLKKASLYADTIILNDNILSELWSWQKKGKTGWEISFPIVLSWAIDFLYLRGLFVSNMKIPVCSLAPPLAWSHEKESFFETADNLVHQNEILLGSRVFGRKFSSYEELTTFLKKIASPEAFFSLAKDLSLLYDPNGVGISMTDFEGHKSYFETKYRRSFDDDEIYGSFLRGVYSTAIYDLFYHGRFKSVIGTDFKGNWKSLIWLMQNSGMDLSTIAKAKVATRDSALLHALQENVRWLGNIPLDRIEELRERGELQDLRDLLGRNVKTIEEASDEEFFEVGQQVKYNIGQAIKKHSSEVQDLNEEYRKKYNLKIPSLIVTGALGIAAAISPPLATVASVLGTTLGGTTVVEIIKDYQEKRNKIKELQKKPVAMLFDAQSVDRSVSMFGFEG